MEACFVCGGDGTIDVEMGSKQPCPNGCVDGQMESKAELSLRKFTEGQGYIYAKIIHAIRKGALCDVCAQVLMAELNISPEIVLDRPDN
jgi:hypothetical protein